MHQYSQDQTRKNGARGDRFRVKTVQGAAGGEEVQVMFGRTQSAPSIVGRKERSLSPERLNSPATDMATQRSCPCLNLVQVISLSMLLCVHVYVRRLRLRDSERMVTLILSGADVVVLICREGAKSSISVLLGNLQNDHPDLDAALNRLQRSAWHVYIHIYKYICICICLSIYVYVSLYMYIYVYI